MIINNKISQKIRFFYTLPVIIISALIVVAIIYAWTEPNQPPPEGNVPAPINVGTTTQYKAGALGIGGILRAYSYFFVDERIGIGTTNPQAVLDVEGDIRIGGLIDQPSYSLSIGVGAVDIYGSWEGPTSTPQSDTCDNNTTTAYTCLPLEARTCIDVFTTVTPGPPGTPPTTNWYKRSITCVIDSAIYKIRNAFGTLQFINSAENIQLVFGQDGNIGIGTTTPAQKLHVQGNLLVTGTTTANKYCIGTNCITAWPVDAPTYWRLSGNNLYTSSTAWNVGIGTTTPGRKLHISGGQVRISNNEARNYYAGAVGTLELQNTNTTLGAINSVVFQNAGGFYIGGIAGLPLTDASQNRGGHLTFWTKLADGTGLGERMRITDSGNIGIGTTAPGAKLHILQSGTTATGSGIIGIRTTLTHTPTTTGNYYPWGAHVWSQENVSLGITNTGHIGGQYVASGLYGAGSISRVIGQIIFHGILGTAAGNVTNSYGLAIHRYIRSGNVTNSYDLYIAPATGTATNRWAIYQTEAAARNYFAGNVGIGTTNPKSKLEVNGASYFRTLPAPTNVTARAVPFGGSGLGVGTYHYLVFAYDANGLNSLGSNQVSCTVEGGTNDACEIEWSAVSGAASYRVYRRDTNNVQGGYWSTTSTSFTDDNQPNPAPGTSPTTAPSAVFAGTLRIQPGLAPTSPHVGDIWTTGNDLWFRTNATSVNILAQGTTFPLLAPSGSVTAPTYSFLGNTNTGIFRPATNTLAFTTNGTERMRINSAGNVGIGTTTPGRKLHISGGQVRISNNEARNYYAGAVGTLELQNTNTTLGAINSVVFQNAGGFYIGGIAGLPLTDASQNRGGHLTFWTKLADGTGLGERMRITDSGNIGIGTTAPGAKLHILQSGTTATGSGIIGIRTTLTHTPTTTGNYYPWGAHVWSQENVSLGITNTGHIGGQYVASGLYGAGSISRVIGQIIFHGILGTAAGNVTNSYGLAIHRYIRSGNVTNSYDLYIAPATGTATNRWAIYQTEAAARNYFAGNVGIGTTNPKSKLEVNGASYFRTLPAPTNVTARAVPFGGSGLGVGTYHYLVFAYDANGLNSLGSNQVSCTVEGGTNDACEIEWSAVSGAASYRVYRRDTNNVQGGYWSTTSTSFTDDNQPNPAPGTSPTTAPSAVFTGNVGIGTTSPGAMLHISGVPSQLRITQTDTGGRTYEVGVGRIQTNAHFSIADVTGATRLDRLTIDGAGNVGIGTTTPGAPLEISSTNDNILRLRQNETGHPWNYIEWYNSEGRKWWSGMTPHNTFTINPQGQDYVFNITTAGKVGIKTTNPKYALHVNGTIFASTIIAINKNFEILHPLNSQKLLVHSTLEGPEHAVFYRGEDQLVKSEVKIKLPDYFEALTRKEKRTILLTPLEGYSPLYTTEIKDGEFIVRTTKDGNPQQKFYWEVKAIRNDIPLLEVEKNK